MKHRLTAVWFLARKRRAGPKPPAEKLPVRLQLSKAAGDRIAEAPRSHGDFDAGLAATANRTPASASRALSAIPAVVLSSDDGVVTFSLARSANGVTLNRIRRRTRRERVDVSVVFRSEGSFLQWCEADYLRHAYPLLFAELKRNGCALFHRLK